MFWEGCGGKSRAPHDDVGRRVRAIIETAQPAVFPELCKVATQWGWRDVLSRIQVCALYKQM